MFDSISFSNALGVLLGITGASVFIKIGKIFFEMFHAQNWSAKVTGFTVIMYVSISYIAIIAFAGGWVTVFSTFAVEQPVIAIMASKIVILLAGIAAVAVCVAASTLLRRSG